MISTKSDIAASSRTPTSVSSSFAVYTADIVFSISCLSSLCWDIFFVAEKLKPKSKRSVKYPITGVRYEMTPYESGPRRRVSHAVMMSGSTNFAAVIT